jgi:cytochrome c oxidase subunit 1
MNYEYLEAARDTNWFISMAAFTLIAGQVVFMVNFFISLAKGKEAVANPWHATTLEWTLPSPPAHGNFGGAIPQVYRWPYEYSAEDTDDDFTPQTVPADEVPVTA